MSKKERKETLEMAIWINLVVGIYNLFIFTNMDSNFHLILGSLNIGVWVFNRNKLSKHWYDFTWNASSVPSGIYFVRAEAGTEVAIQKVMLLK